jgi:hypothetical protein
MGSVIMCRDEYPFLKEFYVLRTVRFIVNLNQTNKCRRLLLSVRYIFNPYICFGESTAIFREPQVLSASKCTIYGLTVNVLLTITLVHVFVICTYKHPCSRFETETQADHFR